MRLKLVVLPRGEPVTIIGCVPAGVEGVIVKVITGEGEQVGEHELFDME